MSRLAMPQKNISSAYERILVSLWFIIIFHHMKSDSFFSFLFFTARGLSSFFFTLMPYYLIWIWNDPSYDDDMISLLLKFVAQSKEMTLSWKQTFVKRISLLLSVLKASRIIYVLLEDVYNPLNQNYTYLL